MKYSTCMWSAGRLARSAPNSDTRPTMVSSVSSMGGNVRDCKVEDDKVISTTMEASFSDTRDGKYVVCKGGNVGDNGGMTCGAEVSTDV